MRRSGNERDSLLSRDQKERSKQMEDEIEVLTLYRPVCELTGWKEFPPRLPEQPIY
jgi:hypothetical protein